MKNLLFFLFFPALLFSKTIYVKKDATGQNNGTSWQHAFKDLRVAISASEYGDSIWVAQGTYISNLTGEVSAFVLKSGVRLYGGFQGTETTLQQRNWALYETVLKRSYFTERNVVFAEGTDASTLLDGFVIREGRAQPSDVAMCDTLEDKRTCLGGGIYLRSQSPANPTRLSVLNCKIVDNTAAFGGGLAADFYEGSGGFVIKNCYFSNTAYTGGSITVYIGPQMQYPMLMDSCVIENSWATYFGGLYVDNNQAFCPMEVKNTIFRSNSGGYRGGAVQILSAPTIIPFRFENCSFIENVHEPAYGGKGAAISAYYVDIYNCYFDRNLAISGGAINGSYYRIFNSVFTHNQALLNGGALHIGYQNLLVNNSFLYNSANKSGGAIAVVGDTRDTIVNCLFYENQASQSANSILTFAYDTLIFYNSYVHKKDINPVSTLITPSIEMYHPVYPPGAPGIQTDGHLSACSPLLNRGDSSWVQRFGLAYDYAGNTRIQDGLPDLGALETPQFRLSPEALPVSCFGGSDGAILPNPVGGQPPFTFWWNNTSAALNQVPAGEGLLIGLDANGCADTVSLTVPQPEALSGQLYSQAATTLQMPDGQAGLQQASGGQLPYQYLWSNGNTTPQINELSPGWYQLSITDAAGCVWSDSVLVDYSVGVRPLTPNHWHIGPNPATDWLRIWPSEGVAPSGWTLRLLDARGVPVAPTQRLPETGALVPMRHLPAGVYWLQLEKAGEYPQVYTIRK